MTGCCWFEKHLYKLCLPVGVQSAFVLGVFDMFQTRARLASCQQTSKCPSFLFFVSFLKSDKLSPKWSPKCWYGAKLDLYVYIKIWVIITRQVSERPGLGFIHTVDFIVYIKDMFATCLTKMNPAILEAWATFSTKTIAYHCRSQQNIENKNTFFCLKKCIGNAPPSKKNNLQHASPSHQNLVVELNTFSPQQS